MKDDAGQKDGLLVWNGIVERVRRRSPRLRGGLRHAAARNRQRPAKSGSKRSSSPN